MIGSPHFGGHERISATMANDTTVMPEFAWDSVSEGSRIVCSFDELGDTFIGEFQGWETVTNPTKPDETWTQANYRGIWPQEIKGEPAAIAPGYFLLKTMQDHEKALSEKGHEMTGEIHKITYKADVDTGQKSPMKSYTFDVARRG